VNTPLQLDIIASIPAPSGPQSTFAARNQAKAGLQTIHRGTDASALEQNYSRSAVLPHFAADSPKIAAAIRQHWCIENGLHWTLITLGKMPVECAKRSISYDRCQCAQSSRRQTVSGRSPARSNG